MDREQTTIRLPRELKEQLQREADDMSYTRYKVRLWNWDGESFSTEVEIFENYEEAEVEALAKMLYGEARGIASDMEKAACVWCVLNRVDDPRFPDTVLEVLEAPYQFAGYSADYPVLPKLATLAADVLKRYHAEKNGEENVGRVLPAEYLYFTGDGRNNHFTIGLKDAETWDWSLHNSYDD